jgi:antitoxin PrlF
MPEVIATLTSKGQVTVPKVIRERLGVGERGRIVFTVEEDGSVRVRALKYPTLKSLVGAAGKLPSPVGRDLVEIAREERAERRRK